MDRLNVQIIDPPGISIIWADEQVLRMKTGNVKRIALAIMACQYHSLNTKTGQNEFWYTLNFTYQVSQISFSEPTVKQLENPIMK